MMYVIIILILNSVFIMYMKNIERKEILTIVKDNNKLNFLLSGDLYLKAEIPNDEDLNNFIQMILKNRAFELSNLVERVEFLNIEIDPNIDYLTYLK